MPNGGSVNQMESSDLTTISFGELSGNPTPFSLPYAPCNKARLASAARAYVWMSERLGTYFLPYRCVQPLCQFCACSPAAEVLARFLGWGAAHWSAFSGRRL